MIKQLITVLVLGSVAVAQLANTQPSPPAGITMQGVYPAWVGYTGTAISGTGFSLPSGGNCAATNSATLTSCLSSPTSNTTITLTAGVTYTGNFNYSACTAQPVYIISSAYSSLPPEHTRVSTADAVNMPKIVTTNTTAAFTIRNTACNVRFVGVEFVTASTAPGGCSYPASPCFTYFIVDALTPTYTPIADSITFDRCYVHGSSTVDSQHGIVMNGSNYAILDSYIADIHIKGFDSNGLIAYQTPGPFKILNNYIAAAAENILFGGAGGYHNPYVPCDIEVANNTLDKPLTWLTPSLTGQMVVKNIFEVKSGCRILLFNNTLSNIWVAGQNGYAVVLTVRSSQSGDVAVDNDITVLNNQCLNCYSFANSLAEDDQCGNATYPGCTNAGSQDRWLIYNNLQKVWDTTQPGSTIGGSVKNVFMNFAPGASIPNGGTQGQMRNVLAMHNTMIPFQGPPAQNCYRSFNFNEALPNTSGLTLNIWLQDNSECNLFSGDNGYTGNTGLTQYMNIPNTASIDQNARYQGEVIKCVSGSCPPFPGPAGSGHGNIAQTASQTYNAMSILLTPASTGITTDGLTSGYLGGSSFLSTTTSVVSSLPGGANVGQNVTFTATVTPSAATGTVTFMQGTTTMCAASTLSGGIALCIYAFPSATGSPFTVSATYNGDSAYSGSVGTVSQIVNALPPPTLGISIR